MILDYVGDPSRDDSEGWWLLALLASMLLLRLAFFTLNFNVGLQTAIRLGGATQYLGFSKLLRHSIYIRTVSSYLLLSTLPNWFKLVYGGFSCGS